jgi:hypothetical protein
VGGDESFFLGSTLLPKESAASLGNPESQSPGCQGIAALKQWFWEQPQGVTPIKEALSVNTVLGFSSLLWGGSYVTALCDLPDILSLTCFV